MAEWTKDRSLSNLAKWLDPEKGATPTHPVADMIRWNSSLNKFQIYSGTAWGDLTTNFAIPVGGITFSSATNTFTLTKDSCTLTRSGAHTCSLVTTGATSVTLPTTGTLATLAGNEALTNKTVNGMSVSSASNTFTLTRDSCTLVRSGAHGCTLTTTGTTTVTLPTSGTLATTGNLSQFASTTSAQLAGVISDETGSGLLVFGTRPTLTNPAHTTQTLSFASPITWNMDSGHIAAVTLTASGSTLSNPTNLRAGSHGFIDIIQDGTGGRTILWGSNYRHVLGVTPELSTAIGARDRFYWSTFDGSIIDITHAKGMA